MQRENGKAFSIPILLTYLLVSVCVISPSPLNNLTKVQLNSSPRMMKVTLLFAFAALALAQYAPAPVGYSSGSSTTYLAGVPNFKNLGCVFVICLYQVYGELELREFAFLKLATHSIKSRNS